MFVPCAQCTSYSRKFIELHKLYFIRSLSIYKRFSKLSLSLQNIFDLLNVQIQYNQSNSICRKHTFQHILSVYGLWILTAESENLQKLAMHKVFFVDFFGQNLAS